jgi:hypothetical protein
MRASRFSEKTKSMPTRPASLRPDPGRVTALTLPRPGRRCLSSQGLILSPASAPGKRLPTQSLSRSLTRSSAASAARHRRRRLPGTGRGAAGLTELGVRLPVALRHNDDHEDRARTVLRLGQTATVTARTRPGAGAAAGPVTGTQCQNVGLRPGPGARRGCGSGLRLAGGLGLGPERRPPPRRLARLYVRLGA